MNWMRMFPAMMVMMQKENKDAKSPLIAAAMMPGPAGGIFMTSVATDAIDQAYASKKEMAQRIADVINGSEHDKAQLIKDIVSLEYPDFFPKVLKASTQG